MMNMRISNMESENSNTNAKLQMLQGANEELENNLQYFDKEEIEQMRVDYNIMRDQYRYL